MVLGPLMFWVYIVLVYFVLMSMFIALISEAYASVREESDKLIVPRIRRMGYSDLRAVTGEARRRMELSRDNNLISNKLYQDLQPFQKALDGQFAKREEQEAKEEQARMLDDAVKPRSFCRRGAGAIAPDGEAAPRGGCCSGGSKYWAGDAIAATGEKGTGARYCANAPVAEGELTFAKVL